MTQRTELQNQVLEIKSIIFNWMAGKLFTFRQTGLDGWIKRRLLPADSAPGRHREGVGEG